MDKCTVQMEAKAQKQEQLFEECTTYRCAEAAPFEHLLESSAHENIIVAVHTNTEVRGQR